MQASIESEVISEQSQLTLLLKANVIYGAIPLCGDYSCPWVALRHVYRQAYRTHQLTPGLKSCILNTKMHSRTMDMITFGLEEGLVPRYDIQNSPSQLPSVEALKLTLPYRIL